VTAPGVSRANRSRIASAPPRAPRTRRNG
jgi:hypothetical protein